MGRMVGVVIVMDKPFADFTSSEGHTSPLSLRETRCWYLNVMPPV
jgi:hypothetical protein